MEIGDPGRRRGALRRLPAGRPAAGAAGGVEGEEGLPDPSRVRARHTARHLARAGGQDRGHRRRHRRLHCDRNPFPEACRRPRLFHGAPAAGALRLRRRTACIRRHRPRPDLFLNRAGFDAFVLGEGKNAEDALAAFDDFPENYQGDAVQALPLFRRRAA